MAHFLPPGTNLPRSFRPLTSPETPQLIAGRMGTTTSIGMRTSNNRRRPFMIETLFLPNGQWCASTLCGPQVAEDVWLSVLAALQLLVNPA